MRPLLLALVLLPFLAGPAPAAADDPAQSGAEPVGKIVAIEGKVSATLNTDTRSVGRSDAVYKGDWIETEKGSRAKIRLNDETELVVGPVSRLHIDDFVYTANNDKGKVLLEVGVGLLRFTSGVLEPESYEVKTPVASIGIRGTIFDVLVSALDYATTVILRDGKIWIKTFGGVQNLNREDDASTAPSSTEKPTDPKEATEEEEERADPLKPPFKDEMGNAGRRPPIPSNVQTPKIDPNQHRPSPSNRPTPSNTPSYPRGGSRY